MWNIQLTAEEGEAIHDLLLHGIKEIDVEIVRTDTHEFKEMLKRRKTTLEQALAKLNASTPVLM